MSAKGKGKGQQGGGGGGGGRKGGGKNKNTGNNNNNNNVNRVPKLFFASPKEEVDAVKFWVSGKISELSPVHLSYEAVEDLLRIPGDDEMGLALMEMVGESDQAFEFVGQVVQKRAQLVQGSSGVAAAGDQGVVVYKKTALQAQTPVAPQTAQNDAKKTAAAAPSTQKPNDNATTKKGKKNAGQKREECYCMGSEHDVLGNCLACGKIICAHEGKLPCTFCGQEFSGPKKFEGDNKFAQAVARKDALLDYEKRSVARSLIYDDQSDYFSQDSSNWHSKDEREKLKALEKDRRDKKKTRAIKIALDIFGRRIIQVEDENAKKSIYEPLDVNELLKEDKKPHDEEKEKAEREAAAKEEQERKNLPKATYVGKGNGAAAAAEKKKQQAAAVSEEGSESNAVARAKDDKGKIKHKYYDEGDEGAV